MRDYSNEKVLDRLGMYERRIEGSLYRTMKELQNRRLLRKPGPADGGTGEKNPAQREPMADSAKQSQSPPADGGDGPPCKADGLSCETNPIVKPDSEPGNAPLGDGEGLLCETNPIPGGETMPQPAGS